MKNWEQSQDQEKRKKPSSNIYIIKPGEVTNRGHGISVESELKDIEEIVGKTELHKNGN